MSLEDEAWDQSTFAKNRDRLIEHEVARRFFEEVVRAAEGGATDVERALHRRRHAD